MARGQNRQRGVEILGPGPVVTIQRRHDRLRRIRNEGARQHRVKPDQMQREGDDAARGGLVGLDHAPGRGGLQIFVAKHPEPAEFLGGAADVNFVHRLFVGRQPLAELRHQRGFPFGQRHRGGHFGAEFRIAELRHPADEVAQNVGQILVHRGLEILPGEFGIRAFGRMGQKPPAPVVRGQDAKRLIHEHAAPARGRELAAVIVQVVEGLDVIHELPRLGRAKDGRGEGQRMEGHVVLAHELGIGHVACALIEPPPARPVAAGLLGPFLRARDIFDRRVEPDVEDLAFHPRPGRPFELCRNAPAQIAGDAAVLQPLAVKEPFLRDRGREHRPVGLAVDPGGQLVLHRRLAQEQMLRLAHLQIGRARDHRARVDQIDRVKLLRAIVALIAAGAVKTAVRAGALDVAVGQEAAVGHRIHLFFGDFADQPLLGQHFREMLGQGAVLRAGRPAEVIEAQPEAARDRRLHVMHLRAIVGDGLARLGRRQFRGRAVFVGRTDEHHLVAAPAQIARVKIGRQLAAHKVAQMLDAVDIGNRRGDEMTRHDPCPLAATAAL